MHASVMRAPAALDPAASANGADSAVVAFGPDDLMGSRRTPQPTFEPTINARDSGQPAAPPTSETLPTKPSRDVTQPATLTLPGMIVADHSRSGGPAPQHPVPNANTAAVPMSSQ